ncbi:MAG TPA: tetratricopeptide repeat protein [Edaphobacter sp.]|jgi:tetratricopeptide (TPR) repeat protein|nr:tetratricopeptide repeat protein [Edaphobacter sp.]
MAARRSSALRHTPPSKTSPLQWCIDHERLTFLIISTLWVFALYWNAIGAPFLYDDLDQILNNPSLANWHTFAHRFLLAPVAFTTDFRGAGGLSYRPLYWITLALDRHLWQLNPTGFHLTNLLLHIANGFLGFRLLRRLNTSLVVAASTSLLWLALPIHAETVAWISGRAYSLSTFFILLSLLLASHYLRTNKSLSLVLYFFTSMAALLSHELGLLVLPLTLLVAYVMSDAKRRSLLPLSSASILSSALYFILKHIVAPNTESGPAAIRSFALIFWKYVLWIILPIHMSVERSTSTPPNTLSSAAIAAWIGLAALIALIFLLRKSRPTPSAGLLWLLVALIPFCGLVFIYQGMAERFTYLASMGLALCIASLAVEFRQPTRNLAPALILIWITWGVYRLHVRVLDWTDPIALYRHSIEATPNSPTLFYNLGYSLREAGNLPQAEEAYREALRLHPHYQQALASLGDIYARQGKNAKAYQAYREALDLKPDDAPTILNLGVLYQQIGAPTAAENQFRRVIDLAPNDSAAYTDLGVLLYQQGKANEAAKIFAQAIDNKSSDPTPYYDLAMILQRAGRGDLALVLYKKVLEMKPNDPDTIANIQALQGTTQSNPKPAP